VESIRQALKLELRPMMELATPVVLAELGWMSMGIVDTMVVGHLSTAAMGAVSIGGVLFSTAAWTGAGLLLGLDTLISQSFGAGDVADCHRSLLNAIYMSVPISAALMGVMWLGTSFLRNFGIDPVVLSDTIPFLRSLMWGTFPLLLYFAFRRYLQGMNLVKPVMFALISANALNLAGDWILVFGHFGAPAMGAEGSGWATCASLIYMAAVLLAYILYHDRRYRTGLMKTPLTPDIARIFKLVKLGLAAALQITFEISVWAAATTLIGRLCPEVLAAHQVAINTVSLTFMVPLGIGAAAAVRVGQALGRGDMAAASRSGWTATLLGAGFMCCAAVVLLVAPQLIIRAYTADPNVMRAGVTLLAIAAAFQLFDGIQAVLTGALRGAGNTRTPMLCHLVAYWGLGLPMGYYLCFGLGFGAAGLWTGLCVAIIVIGMALLWAWSRAIRAVSGQLSAVSLHRPI
jgi:MATE family multidrug resistance protein